MFGRYVFFGKFLTMTLTSLVVKGLFRLFHLEWVLIVCDLQGIGPFYLSYQIHMHIRRVAHIIPLLSF